MTINSNGNPLNYELWYFDEEDKTYKSLVNSDGTLSVATEDSLESTRITMLPPDKRIEVWYFHQEEGVYKPLTTDGKISIDGVISGGGNTGGEMPDSSQIAYTTEANASIANIKDALDSLLYVSPSINSFTVSPSLLEKGAIINELIFRWSLNKDINSQSINQNIGNIEKTIRTYTLNSEIKENKSFTLTINDGKNTNSKSVSVAFNNKRYFGASNLASLENADILALNSELATSRTQTKSFDTSSQYIYFAFPSSFGSPSFKVNGLDNDAWIKTTMLFTNSNGYKENYDIYRSEFLQNGIGLTVNVT